MNTDFVITRPVSFAKYCNVSPSSFSSSAAVIGNKKDGLQLMSNTTAGTPAESRSKTKTWLLISIMDLLCLNLLSWDVQPLFNDLNSVCLSARCLTSHTGRLKGNIITYLTECLEWDKHVRAHGWTHLAFADDASQPVFTPTSLRGNKNLKSDLVTASDQNNRFEKAGLTEKWHAGVTYH